MPSHKQEFLRRCHHEAAHAAALVRAKLALEREGLKIEWTLSPLIMRVLVAGHPLGNRIIAADEDGMGYRRGKTFGACESALDFDLVASELRNLGIHDGALIATDMQLVVTLAGLMADDMFSSGERRPVGPRAAWGPAMLRNTDDLDKAGELTPIRQRLSYHADGVDEQMHIAVELAANAVSELWPAITALASALAERGVIPGDRAEAILTPFVKDALEGRRDPAWKSADCEPAALN